MIFVNDKDCTNGPQRITEFEFMDKVHIDEDRSIVARITSFLIKKNGLQVELSWFANGTAQSGWFDDCRLTLVESKED